MNNATLVGLMMLVVGGCAREATVAKSAPVHGAARECPAYLSPGAMADCRAGYVECGDGPQTGPCSPEAQEERAALAEALAEECQAPASRAWNKARNASYHRSPESAKAAADEAYEDVYARCLDGDVPLADPNEEHCMAVAELAYERAAGYAMTSLGDAPVPDAAYEDAYARCTEGR